jgi:hypothetical protein
MPKDDLVFHPGCFLECYGLRCSRCTRAVARDKALSPRERPCHAECFACVRCGDREVASGRILALHGFPYCARCYDAATAALAKCIACRKPVLPGEPAVAFFCRGRRYAAHHPHCYRCAGCGQPPEAGSARACAGRLVCAACADAGARHVCAECNLPIFANPMRPAGARVFWHPEHFVCACGEQLRPETAAAPFTGVLQCKKCASVARTHCRECAGEVHEGVDVFACGGPWHAACFRCQACARVVDRRRAINVRGRPCCQDCRRRITEEKKIDGHGRPVMGAFEGAPPEEPTIGMRSTRARSPR